jgi:hypothetical protein
MMTLPAAGARACAFLDAAGISTFSLFHRDAFD